MKAVLILRSLILKPSSLSGKHWQISKVLKNNNFIDKLEKSYVELNNFYRHENIDKAESDDDDATFGKILFYVFGLVIGIICSGMCIFGAIAFEENNKYPASKYRIETEITTRGEQSDTTYVIVKK